MAIVKARLKEEYRHLHSKKDRDLGLEEWNEIIEQGNDKLKDLICLSLPNNILIILFEPHFELKYES